MTFPRAKHHIVFASGQALPLVLGAAVPHAEPACVHIITTDAMKQSGRILRKALEGRGRQCREHALKETSQQHIFDALDAIREECGAAELALNLTGGTKLMTLAAAEWADAYAVPAFYVDTGADSIVLIGRRWEYLPLPDVLDLRGLLAASGYSMGEKRQEAVPQERRRALDAMLRLVCGEPRALASLNGCAQEAYRTGRLMVDDRAVPSAAWTQLLNLCEQVGMLRADHGCIEFCSEQARKWCNGGWFEEYVQMVLFRLQCGKRITSWASSVQVRDAENVENELDALFCARNRLFTIECKTAIMARNAGEDRKKVASMLYKADSLHDRLGGVFARAMLCSVLPLEAHDRERARALHIPVTCGADLLQLEDRLTRWITGA